jgi:hypothetical protein
MIFYSVNLSNRSTNQTIKTPNAVNYRPQTVKLSLLNQAIRPIKIFDFSIFAVFLHSKLLRAHT